LLVATAQGGDCPGADLLVAYCTAAAVPGSIVFLILLADQKRRKKSDGEAVIEAGRWPSVAQSQFGRVAVAKPDEARSFRKRSGRLPVAVVPHLQLPYRSMIRFLSFFFSQSTTTMMVGRQCRTMCMEREMRDVTDSSGFLQASWQGKE